MPDVYLCLNSSYVFSGWVLYKWLHMLLRMSHLEAYDVHMPLSLVMEVSSLSSGADQFFQYIISVFSDINTTCEIYIKSIKYSSSHNVFA